MKSEQRIVTKLPLVELWDEGGTFTAGRIRNLDQDNISEVLRAGSVRFVVADSGLPLNWIPTQHRFDFWKTVQSQIAHSSRPILLELFLNKTAYTAAEWRGRGGECVILLEKTPLRNRGTGRSNSSGIAIHAEMGGVMGVGLAIITDWPWCAGSA